MSSKALMSIASNMLRVNPTTSAIINTASAIGLAVDLGRRLTNQQRQEESKFNASRGYQQLTMIEEQKQYEQPLLSEQFAQESSTISAIENVDISQRELSLTFEGDLAVNNNLQFRQLFNIDIEGLISRQQQTAPFFQIILDVVRSRLFQGVDIGDQSRNIDMLIMVLLFDQQVVNMSQGGQVSISLNSDILTILQQFKRVLESKTKDKQGADVSRLRSSLSGSYQSLIRIINASIFQQKNNRRDVQLFSRQLSHIEIMAGLRIQSIIVSYYQTFRLAYNQIYNMEGDSQYNARLYAFMFMLSIDINVEGFQSLSTLLPENQLQNIIAELHDLATNQSIPNVAVRLQQMSVIRRLSFGSVYDINQMLVINEAVPRSVSNDDNDNMLSYIIQRMQSVSQPEQQIDSILLDLMPPQIVNQEISLVVQEYFDAQQPVNSGYQLLPDDIQEEFKTEQDWLSYQREKVLEDLSTQAKQQQLQQSLLYLDTVVDQSTQAETMISSSIELSDMTRSNITQQPTTRNIQTITSNQPISQQAIQLSNRQTALVSYWFQQRREGDDVYYVTQTQAQREIYNIYGRNILDGSVIDQADINRQQAISDIRNSVNASLERQFRQMLGLNASYLGLTSIMLYRNELLSNIDGFLKRLLRDRQPPGAPRADPNIKRPPDDGDDIDVNGDIVIRKKRQQQLPPATFIIKKDLEIQRRELADMTPIERVLAPQAQKKRGRPRKEIPAIQQLYRDENNATQRSNDE